MTASSPAAASPVVLQRARGRAEVGFALRDGATRLARLAQEGQAKIRLPKVYGEEPATAVTINTAGGVAGGDRLIWGARFGAGVRACVTSQAAERVYRSSATDGSLAGEIETTLHVEAGAEAEWLPQETILFDRAHLSRRLTVEMAADARALMVESIVFGRTAMGEEVEDCRLVDRWRIRRGGRLVFADTFRVEGAAREILAGRATGGGARAFATLVLVAPDAEARLDGAREAIEAAGSVAGASAFDGLLVARLAGADARALRADLAKLIVHIRRAELPRVWSC
ncbi:MAG: urease accessory protein UreD [Hyphomicrobiales bacterium]|nr:urease accessory protein UreD [Hyphomicrobiales bacterium]